MTRALLLLSCSCLAMAQSPAPADWRFAQPDADIKMSVNLQAVMKSDGVAKAIERIKAQAKDNTAQVDMVAAMLRTVDRVSVSGIQRGSNDVDVLAEVTGSFDPQIIAGFFPSTGAAKVKVVAPHTILIGEGDTFAAALDRLNGPPVEDTSGLAQSDIWIDAGASFLAKQQSGQQAPPMLKDLRGVALGLTLSDAPVFDLVLTEADDAGAASLLQTVQAMTPLLASQPNTAALMKNLNLSQDGARLRLHLVVPPEVVAQIQQQAAAAASSSAGGLPPQLAPLLGVLGIGGNAANGQSKPAAGAAPAPPQNDGAVKIYGLDDGPKEVPAPK